MILNYKNIIKLYLDKNKSLYEIAKTYSTYPTKIYRLLLKYKIKIRNKKEAKKVSKNKYGGKKHWQWRNGISLKNNYCICGKKIYWRSIWCKSCAKKDGRSPLFLDGRSFIIHYCKYGCGANVSGNNRGCKKCTAKNTHKLNCQCCVCKNRRGEYEGKKHPNYIDGRSYFPYSQEFNKKLRENIHKRDNFTCQNCGMTEEEHIRLYKQVLHVHHIDYNKLNLDIMNLISLCIICNIKANSNRKYWQEYLSRYLSKKA